MANFTTTSWINARFKSEDEEGQEPYLPAPFLRGAKAAVKKFFFLLQEDIAIKASSSPQVENDHGEEGENGAASPLPDSDLKRIVSKNLYQQLSDHHAQFAKLGLSLEMRLNSISNIECKDTWISFGKPSLVSSTLNKADIHTSIAPLVYWRHVPGSKAFFFSELNFEYALPASAVPGSDNLKEDLTGPAFEPRLAATREGAVLGIDVSFDVDLTVSIYSNTLPSTEPGTDDNKEVSTQSDSTSPLWITTIRRPLLVRLETSHFTGRYNGGWKIADVDNFFASKLF